MSSLIVDGIIESPKTARMTDGMPPGALVRQDEVVAAVRYLATQSARGVSHELVLTPSGDRWVRVLGDAGLHSRP